MYYVFYVFMFYVGVSENIISFSYHVFLICCGNDNKAPLNLEPRAPYLEDHLVGQRRFRVTLPCSESSDEIITERSDHLLILRPKKV